MGLLGDRQVHGVNGCFQVPFPAERGGALTIGSYSGVHMLAYHNEPSGRFCIGVLLHDVESLDLSRQYHPGGIGRAQREVSQPLDIAQVITEGEITTDFIDPQHNNIGPGAPAYVGPSGLITDRSDYGGKKIGYFLSSVGSSHLGLPEHETNQVLVLGGGLRIQIPDVGPNGATVEFINEKEVRTNVAGWARVRLQILGN